MGFWFLKSTFHFFWKWVSKTGFREIGGNWWKIHPKNTQKKSNFARIYRNPDKKNAKKIPIALRIHPPKGLGRLLRKIGQKNSSEFCIFFLSWPNESFWGPRRDTSSGFKTQGITANDPQSYVEDPLGVPHTMQLEFRRKLDFLIFLAIFLFWTGAIFQNFKKPAVRGTKNTKKILTSREFTETPIKNAQKNPQCIVHPHTKRFG